MARLKANLIANFAGQAAATAIQLTITPLYLRTLGVEAYGLIGFQITLQALMQVLDFGLSPTINRELARYSALPDKAQESRDFVRTLEVGYWLIGVVIGLAIYAASPFLTLHWLNQSSLPASVVEQSLRIIAVLIAAQWPLTLYQGGLLGLQRHPSLNIVRAAMTATAAVGGYLVITRISPSVAALFAWQAAVSLGHVAIVMWLLWRSLPPSRRPARIRFSAIRHTGRFAAGMTVITITGLLLSQLDRLVLSRVVSLEQFGYYVIAGMMSINGLYAVIRPMFMSIFPRFSELVASSDTSSVERTYRRGWQLMMGLIVPATALIVMFSDWLILLWTRDSVVAQAAGPIASLLVIGTALNGLMNVPFALQLARGWTSLSVKVNIVLALLACPAIFFAAQWYGTVAAAAVWPASMAVYMLVALPAIHRALLPTLGMRWFLKEIAAPIVVVLLAAAVLRAFLPVTADRMWMAAELALAWLSAEAALVVASGTLRRDVMQFARKFAAYARNRPFELTT